MVVHIFDNDACCMVCGFDGVEYHWLNYNTYEGVVNFQFTSQCDVFEYVCVKVLAMQPTQSIDDDDDWEQDYGNDDDAEYGYEEE